MWMYCCGNSTTALPVFAPSLNYTLHQWANQKVPFCLTGLLSVRWKSNVLPAWLLWFFERNEFGRNKVCCTPTDTVMDEMRGADLGCCQEDPAGSAMRTFIWGGFQGSKNLLF